MDDLCEANGSFAINLLKMLGKEDSSRNVFCSPLSISSALAMVFMGAKGNTATQMSQVCLPVAEEERWAASLLPDAFFIPHHSGSPPVWLVGGEGHRGEGKRADMGRNRNYF